MLKRDNSEINDKERGEPKILIVEDDARLGKTLSDVLEVKGYSPIAVLTGKEGVAAAKEEDISLALLDLKLPDISGIEVLKEIKKISPRTEAIILTAFASLETAMEAVSQGAFSYLQKPYDMERLLLDIRRALERKWAEESLKKSEQRYRRLFEAANDCIYTLDLKGNFTSASRRAEEISGYKKEELLGKSISCMLTEEELKAQYEKIKQIAAGQRIPPYEIEIITKDGSVKPLELSIHSIEEEGKITGVLGIARDITERKRAEDMLHESEEKYRTLFENPGTAMAILEEDTTISLCNKEFEKLSGYSKEEIEGKKSWTEFAAPEELERLRKHHYERRKKGEKAPTSYEFKGVDRKGNGMDIYIDVGIIPGTKKSVISLTDITRQKATENALRAAYKELETLDKMKTDFLSVAYHEMLTPLTPIVGYTNLLEQGELTDKQKNYVRIIEESASQLEELINRLLEVTRMDAGRIELKLEPVSIPGIVTDMLERIKPQVDAKKQTTSTAVPEGIEVEGDKQKITAIFDNLISNAIKYTGEKGRIDIVVEDREEEGDIRVCVADTGAGISEEQLPRVFERFYMVDTSLTRKGGLGLGLAIVKGYVELHGGKAWVTSELGKGSRFCFTLPKKAKEKLNATLLF